MHFSIVFVLRVSTGILVSLFYFMNFRISLSTPVTSPMSSPILLVFYKSIIGKQTTKKIKNKKPRLPDSKARLPTFQSQLPFSSLSGQFFIFKSFDLFKAYFT